MATFYGTVSGHRETSATRTGTRNSGIRASAQSYNGSIIVLLRYNDKNELIATVGTNEGTGAYTDYESNDFIGTFEDFKKLLKLHKDIKNGKVKITHHREKAE